MRPELQDRIDEVSKSERPALDQLRKMGYNYLSQRELNKTRRDYREVLLYDRLEASLRKLNPELDEEGIRDALHQIEEQNYSLALDHLDTNEKIRAKLVGLSRSGDLEPITVVQDFGNGPEYKTVRLFNFDDAEDNDFLVTNQFEFQGFKEAIYPDIVVFVNGIPLVVIECKSPAIPKPIEQAVERNLEKYQAPRLGYDRLFFYNHFLIATCGTLARHGTIGASVNHYARWSEAFPLTLEGVEKRFGRHREQEILIAGMLAKSHLLDLLKNYVIYEVVNNRKIKKVAKHQQYRVVTKAVNRLDLKKDVSDKGGVIWHTQGSGKSLSMLWFATQLIYKLGNPPILIVTDRKQLDEQIERTFRQCGFPDPIRATSVRHLGELLSNPQGKTVMTTIHKFGARGNEVHTDAKVVVLVDEAHRTQYKFNAESMRAAMPNAVFFAFTGTPIDKKNKSTYRVFGPMLDKYSFEESKADGATLRIRYQDRMPELSIEGGDTVDRIFERVFSDLDQKTKTRLKKEYVTKDKIAEAPSRIRKIAADLVDHYTKHISPNGYKAMVVASSREAAVTYKRELDKMGAPHSKIIMTSQLGEKGKDDTSWDQYYLSPTQREDESEKFKSPEDPTRILIVVDMLLVGYDVPIVQVLYLDKALREHNLLQAIARVNRPYDETKTYGLIVDYSGVTKELHEALAVFEEEDVKGALEPSNRDLENLEQRHLSAVAHLKDLDKNDDSAIIARFEPIDKRDEFEYDFKEFAKALDVILPDKEADQYIDDFRYMSKVRQMIRTYYGGVGLSLREYGKKVQQLIDDYVRSLGISELVNPQEITYENFAKYAVKFKDERARAALVKNKARQVIEEFAHDNPAYYERLRERLQQIIEEEEKRRKENADYFSQYQAIIQAALEEQKEREKLGFSTRLEFAIYGEIQSAVNNEKVAKNATESIFRQIQPETQLIGWKGKTSSGKRISVMVYDVLRENVSLPEAKLDELVDGIVQLVWRLL